jgi:hypothetical protein
MSETQHLTAEELSEEINELRVAVSNLTCSCRDNHLTALDFLVDMHEASLKRIKELIAEREDLAADRDSWQQQASDRVDDALGFLERAQRAEAERDEARGDALRDKFTEGWKAERIARASAEASVQQLRDALKLIAELESSSRRESGSVARAALAAAGAGE